MTTAMHSRDSFLAASWPARSALILVSVLMMTVAQAQAPRAPQAAPAASPQPTYKTPEEASQALLDAVKAKDAGRLKDILGDSGLVETEEPELDALEKEQFAQKYGELHRLVRRTDGSYVLKIGPENWPFPVPIVAQDDAWRFDSGAGLREVVFRRIGENELTAIDVSRALAAAMLEPAKEHQDEVIARLLATAHPGAKPERHHGYDFKVVPGAAGHFIVVAYPAEYRSSGVVTFVAGPDGIVYEKDLGRHSASAAQALKTFQPDATWRRAEEDETPKSP